MGSHWWQNLDWSKKAHDRIMGSKKSSIPMIPADVVGNCNLHVTLWPAFPHFPKFADNSRVQGIRLNSAMMAASEIDDNFVKLSKEATVPLWFDVKGMQMRIKEVVCDHHHDHLEFILNRPVRCKTPCGVYFKGGEDCGKLLEIKDGGTHFIFEGGPKYEVRAGESIHILDPNLYVGGDPLLDYELEKIEKIKKLGFTRWYLSYVYAQRHVDAFREVIGEDAELILKIENLRGLEYVERDYRSPDNTHLAAARGDLYVEVERPHHILKATKMIVQKDPGAYVGSRMLLSVIKKMPDGTLAPNYVPSCADLNELAWLYDIGYRNFLLCDELCLKDNLLSTAVNVFEAFRTDYK